MFSLRRAHQKRESSRTSRFRQDGMTLMMTVPMGSGEKYQGPTIYRWDCISQTLPGTVAFQTTYHHHDPL